MGQMNTSRKLVTAEQRIDALEKRERERRLNDALQYLLDHGYKSSPPAPDELRLVASFRCEKCNHRGLRVVSLENADPVHHAYSRIAYTHCFVCGHWSDL